MAFPAAAAGGYMEPAPEWENLLNEIGITSADFYHQIVGAVERGSGDALLNWDDFRFEVNSDYDDQVDVTSILLIAKGMPPLDAIVWCSGQHKPASVVIGTREAADDVEVCANAIYSGFFAWYFSLYTQARAIAQGDPNFLLSVLGMGVGWVNAIDSLSSAELEKFPTEWVKHIDLAGLSTKARNRLALGAAGHRYTSALKYIRPQDLLPDTATGAGFITNIRNWTQDKVWWDLHPLTKAGDIITVTGSLNKLIEDCLSACVSPERLAALVAARILHHVPQAVPTHSNWETFDFSLLPVLSEPIF